MKLFAYRAIKMNACGLLSSNHRTQLADDERMIAAALRHERIEAAMKERFHHLIVVPSHKFERDFAQVRPKHLRRLMTIENDVDLMARSLAGASAIRKKRIPAIVPTSVIFGATFIAGKYAYVAQPWMILPDSALTCGSEIASRRSEM